MLSIIKVATGIMLKFYVMARPVLSHNNEIELEFTESGTGPDSIPRIAGNSKVRC